MNFKSEIILNNIMKLLKMNITSFPCTRCGFCCRLVSRSIETSHLDRGDGTCRNFKASDNSCEIYEERPSICRVDTQYQERFQNLFSWNDFVLINEMACHEIQESFGFDATIGVGGFKFEVQF